MNYWLIKSEPDVYSYSDLEKEGKTVWDGVRNYAARLNLRAMKKGDLTLYYHSMKELQIVGVAKVTREAFPDPKAKEGDWVAVEVSAHQGFKNPVTLEAIKKEPLLKNMDLVRISRLSVGKVTEKEFQKICEMSGTKVNAQSGL